MAKSVTIGARVKEIFRSAFFDLSGIKKRLMQAGLGLFGVGAAGTGYALFADASSEPMAGWSWAAMSSGAGCLLGFFLGAALRIFLKIALFLGVGLAAIYFGLSYLGWLDMGGASFGEISAAVAEYITESFDGFKEFLSGYLPTSILSGAGFASGVTQKPDTDPND